MKVKIKKEEIQSVVGAESKEFPKYTTQLLNLANQNAGATRPNNIGQLSELIQAFTGGTIEEWGDFYNEKHPKAKKKAVKQVFEMVKKLKKAMRLIDKPMIEEWLDDLIITKTYCGLNFQEAILKKVADIMEVGYSLASPEDEAKNIDGYIDDLPVSIKPKSFKLDRSHINIEIPIIYYEKKKDGISIEYKF